MILMNIIVHIRDHERGLAFLNGRFEKLLAPGWHFNVRPFARAIRVVSVREPVLVDKDLDLIARGPLPPDEAAIVDLRGRERALVWADGRLKAILEPGRHIVWKVLHAIEIERIDTTDPRFTHPRLGEIINRPALGPHLDIKFVRPGEVAVPIVDGVPGTVLGPGVYVYWKSAGVLDFRVADMRERVLEIAGQEIMTADRVTLRVTAVLTFRTADAVTALTVAADAAQSIYREAQLALRAVIGTRDLDALLADKEAVTEATVPILQRRAAGFGLAIVSFGVRDIVLPGEIRELMNKVTEARKAAEAALITRREETASVRSQLNTAKLIEGNPTLMRLRELEVTEKLANKITVTLVGGEGGVAKQLLHLV